MDKSSLLEDISKSIEKIEEDYKVIKKKELVNELEIELFVSKTRYLYEKSIALKYISKFINENIEVENNSTLKESSSLVDEKVEEEIELPVVDTTNDVVDNNEIFEEETIHEDIEVENSNLAEEIEEEENKLVNEDQLNIENESTTFAESEDIVVNSDINDATAEVANETEPEKNQEDVYQKIEQIADLNSKLRQENKTSLYERFSQLDKQGDLLNKFQQTPIQDLKKAVGLNERYLFSKALFNNEMSALIDALEKLNNMESFDDALKFISTEFDEKYNWKEHGEEQLLFINTIKRKFVN